MSIRRRLVPTTFRLCAFALATGIAASATAQSAARVHAAPPGLAPTPPMGWNSWNKFGCRIDESLIRETADAMVASGMKDAGYKYVNIDDCWEAAERDASGNLTTEPQRFPSGMKALADYVHAKGLKIGIYSSAGTGTCQRRPASLDHEAADAKTFAAWGIDYLKYDNCNNEQRPALERYKAMGDALAATGRPIVFSLCEWGQNDPWNWGRTVGGDLWRTTGDIRDSWSSMLSILDQPGRAREVLRAECLERPRHARSRQRPHDEREYMAHFSLWALLNAPLIAGNDLRSMSDSTKAILTNREVIAVDQDWGGMQGHKVKDDGELEVWIKSMSNGDRAVVLLNRSSTPLHYSATMQDVGMSGGRHTVRDLWAHADQKVDGEIDVLLAPTSAAMYLVRR